MPATRFAPFRTPKNKVWQRFHTNYMKVSETPKQHIPDPKTALVTSSRYMHVASVLQKSATDYPQSLKRICLSESGNHAANLIWSVRIIGRITPFTRYYPIRNMWGRYVELQNLFQVWQTEKRRKNNPANIHNFQNIRKSIMNRKPFAIVQRHCAEEDRLSKQGDMDKYPCFFCSAYGGDTPMRSTQWETNANRRRRRKNWKSQTGRIHRKCARKNSSAEQKHISRCPNWSRNCCKRSYAG